MKRPGRCARTGRGESFAACQFLLGDCDDDDERFDELIPD